MQPPTYRRPPLRVQLEQLRLTAKQNKYGQPSGHSDWLRTQVDAWAASMSPEQLTRRFTTEEVERLAGLVGTNGGRAAHHHIAQALRAVGFKPRRDWTVAGRNRRYWRFSGEMK